MSGKNKSKVVRADIAILQKGGKRALANGQNRKQALPQQLQNLPQLRRDMPPAKRQSLFKLKLEMCATPVEHLDQAGRARMQEQKRQIILELVKFTTSQMGQKIFTEATFPEIILMLESNIFRELPPQLEDYDPEEDEPVLDTEWPRLQAVYEFMLRFIVSAEVKAKVVKKYLKRSFCKSLIDMFDSEDPRERDYLKTILHRIYGKFMAYRSVIRRYIQYTFFRFVYETERHNGIAELLEILGSIINGFALPLKKEHSQFLARAIVPLHKPQSVSIYHLQLSYCMAQFVEKEPKTAKVVINGLVKYWPWSNTSKQVLFLNELEDIMELIDVEILEDVHEPLFYHLAQCLSSAHFQVQERCLYLWNNEHLINQGCLGKDFLHFIIPPLFAPLQKCSTSHWNSNVLQLAMNVVKLYMTFDLKYWDKLHAEYINDQKAKEEKEQRRAAGWLALENKAAAVEVARISDDAAPAPAEAGAGAAAAGESAEVVE